MPQSGQAECHCIASEGTPQQREAAQLGTLRVLNAVQAKVAMRETTKARPIPKLQPGKALLFMGTKVNGLDTKVLLDSGANQNLVSVEEATRIIPTALCECQSKVWAKLLAVAQFFYNLQRSESTQQSPFEIATSQQPLAPHAVAAGYTGGMLEPTRKFWAAGWMSWAIGWLMMVCSWLAGRSLGQSNLISGWQLARKLKSSRILSISPDYPRQLAREALQ
ncbi:hypothetical protein GH714_039419 [Hevea brasiliensis]|uniref:Uncharacterized protein n=1 Tax=Hevea brasiliensis TaxID=3981 RepID=A0A6A6KNY0_HEVBR|nr:hypothetical protein GH714_039419 [Hevea brasiliensis]